MTVKSSAASHCKKAMKIGLSLFRRGFNSSKCKTMAKMAVARVKLLRNKREVVIKQMRRDIATLLDSGQDATARIRVQHVIREQNIMAANELIELFCELIVARLSIISKQRECPADLKEGISSLIFAGPRCSDIPELLSIRDVFEKKYGRDFVSAATDLRPNAGVNRLLIEKLSVNTPSGETKLKVLKEIAKEYQVQWDTNESEVELLKPPEERIEGPKSFVSATSLPLKPDSKQSSEPDNATNRVEGNNSMTSFHELASAAGAAAEKAVAAAQAAAFLAASHDDQRMPKTKINSKYSPSFEQSLNDGNKKIFRRQSYNCQRENIDIKFDEADCDEEIEMEEPSAKYNRRHSYNAPPPPAESGVRYDEYSNDESGQEEEAGPPARPAPQAPARRVHPKLPDYDALTARFESLKHHKPK